MDNLDSLYQDEIYLGSYRIEWSDQKIIVTCDCNNEELEVFSDSYTYCDKCGRRYSILEIIKVEAPTDKEEQNDNRYI